MKKIFVIEDDPSLAREFQKTLRSEGFSVSIASDGEAGISSIGGLDPDVVVLDLQAPGLNVSDCIHRLRAQNIAKNLPIIALSNNYDKQTIDDAWKAGIVSCLFKSTLTPRSLVASINNALGPDRFFLQPAEEVPGLSVAESPAPLSAEISFRAALRRTFLEEMPERIAQLRSLLAALRTAEATDQAAKVFELQSKARFMASNAALAEVRNVSNLASALEALLKELHEEPENITASTLHTIEITIEFLAALTQSPAAACLDCSASANVLSVDDDPLSRRAVVRALHRANLKCVSLESAHMALSLLAENDFDLVILDIIMPGMNGFELCQQLRAMPQHQETPVIFVTSLDDFESRSNSTLVGGDDLIAKPFVLMELAVKALIYVQREQLKHLVENVQT